MTSFNQSILNGPLLHLCRFVSEIDFAGQSWHDAEVSVDGSDGWAKRGDKQAFGWIVHPQQSVAGRKITIRGIRDGSYEVRFYDTWIGEFHPSSQAECRAGEITITVPPWAQDDDSDTAGHDRDSAFLLTPAASTGMGKRGNGRGARSGRDANPPLRGCVQPAELIGVDSMSDYDGS